MAWFHLRREMPTSLVTREGPLCQTCSDLDFQSFFGTRPLLGGWPSKRFEFDFVINVTTSSLTCPLCSLTRRLRQSASDAFQLFRSGASSTEQVFINLKKSRSGQTKLVCDLTANTEISRAPTLYDWPKDPKRVDFGSLKQKFAQCKTEHGPTCGVKDRTLVEGLRVYNCFMNKLEEATTHTKYVALSYVWGCDPDGSLPKPPEQRRTIRDAIQVALRLGYEYIWVDQLCINQGGTDKLRQIQQMNRIYQNADLTIVAAAGDNSDFGIPGMQDRSRLGRECFRIGDLEFVETMPMPADLLWQTTWTSRAWTFQEEKLSHRLLVFTERAAWFSCYLTTDEKGFEATTPENSRRSYPEIDLALARKTPRPPCGLELPLNIDDLIVNYSQRFLTYPSDAVNAFSGILTELKDARLIVSHVWGTPIMPPIALPSFANRYDPGPQVVHLERSTVDGFIVGLMWYTFRPEGLEPRHGIPTWSWAGWQGIVELNDLYDKENVNFDIEVFIERTDGQVLTWSEFESLSYLENKSHLISRFIRLRAWTIEVRLEYRRAPERVRSGPRPVDEPWRYAVVQMLNGDELMARAVILGEPKEGSSKEQLTQFKCRACTGVCLFPINDTLRSRLYVMLLDKVKGNFQRIGYFALGYSGQFNCLRQKNSSGEVTYCGWKYNGRMPDWNARLEEIRIG